MGRAFHLLRQLAGAGVMLLVALLATVPAHAGTTTSTAKAITLRPLSIVAVRDLDYGGIIPGATGGNVTINPNNDNRTVTGSVIAAGGSPRAAQFYTYGGPRQFVYIQSFALPTLNRAGGGSTILMTAMTLNGNTFRYLDDAGLLDLRIGGTIQIGPNQLEGSYAGTFSITVTYF